MPSLFGKTLTVFKIDIHTHILPENLNELTETFSDPRFLRMDMLDGQNALLKRNNNSFRKVGLNCWHPSKRIEDLSNTKVNMQILSTIPVLFSYWANDKAGYKLSKALNILKCMVNDGEIDSDLFSLFITKKLYLKYADEMINSKQIDSINEDELLGK